MLRSSYTSDGSPFRWGSNSLHDRVQSNPEGLTFDGTGSWDAFLDKYSLFTCTQGWNDEIFDNLCWCLARESYSKYGVSTLQKLSEAALANFGNIRKNPGELLEEWADRVLRLVFSFLRMWSVEYQTPQADRKAGLRVVNQCLATIEEALGRMRLALLSEQIIYGGPKRGGPEYHEG